MKKIILILTGVVFVISAGFLTRFMADKLMRTIVISQSIDKNLAPTISIVPEEKNLQPIKLLFVGDIMLDRGIKSVVIKYGESDFTFPFQKIKSVLQTADFVFGNLEGPLSDKGTDLGKTYSFRMPPAGINGLTFAGFTALSCANNHSDDWGRDAIKDTRARLLAANILPVGIGTEAEAYSPQVVEVKSTKIALLAFADFNVLEATGETVGVARVREEKISEGIKKAKTMADIIIVSFHFGEEYQLTESERQRRLAHFAIDAGADLVVGTHPHVLEPLEEYKGKYIAYSLGNFVFDQNFNEVTKTGGLLEVNVEKGKITTVILKKIHFNQYFQPKLSN